MNTRGWIRTLVVEPVAGASRAWELRGYAIERVVGLEAALVAMDREPRDCVMVAFTPDVGSEFLSALRAGCEAQGLPLVLLASPSTEREFTEALAGELFDGFIDLGWPPEVMAAATWSTLHRFLVSRNLVEIQRAVLDTARTAASSLQSLVFRDDLTALNNLRYFQEVLGKEHARCQRHQRTYTLVYFDLDGLRAINSQHGHAAGGQVLIEVGKVIAAQTRTCDYSFRVGGDEFVTLIVDTGKEAGRVFAERVRQAIRATTIPFGDVQLTISVSAGIATYPEDGEASAQVLERADRAVFMAKAAGKDRVVCHGG